MAVGYVTGIALDDHDEIIGYQFVSLGKFTDFIKAGDTPNDAWEKAKGQYGRVGDSTQRKSLTHLRSKEDKRKWLYLNHMKEELIKSTEVLGSYGIASIEEAEKITKDAGLDVYNQVKEFSQSASRMHAGLTL